MIHLKTPEEIAVMREGGRKLGSILEDLLAFSTPGVVLTDIEKRACALIEKAGATASFKTVPGYKWATCLNVNEVVVHGIPTNYVLHDGDILTIDMGILYKGFHTDTAGTKSIGLSKKNEEFLNIGKKALEKAIEQSRIGNRIGNISKVIEETIESAGYSIVKSLVGHGIGRELHEEPQIPNFLRGTIENTLPLQEGMTIAIEPIYSAGGGEIVYQNTDGWTLATRDRSLTAVFEHTLAITTNGPYVLTKAEN
jgi:methionyl aminopeptidase